MHMLGTATFEDPTQLLLDMRPYEWVQQELDLEYLPQPQPDQETGTIVNWSYNDAITASIINTTAAPTLHVRTSSETSQSRLIISPELVIEMPRKPPNRLVRFLHKHLLNFTWETV